jgi:AraC-like DNA-binding protein
MDMTSKDKANEMDVILTHRWGQIDLDVIECGTEKCLPSYSYGPAVRDFYIIHFIHSGKGYFKLGEKEYYLKEGEGFFIHPDLVSYYCADSEDPWHYSWVMFHGKKSDLYLDKACISIDSPILRYSNMTFIWECFSDMMKTKDSLKSKEIKLLSSLLKLFSFFIDNAPDTNTVIEESTIKSSYIQIAIDYIQFNYNKKIKITDIADHIGIDSKYLCSLFKSTLAVSPYQYLLNIRFNKASELLKNENFSIADISRSVGYEDPLLFSKMFKKIKGMSPSEYRKLYT